MALHHSSLSLRSINNKRIGPTKDLSLITWRATKLKGGSQILRIQKGEANTVVAMLEGEERHNIF